MTSPPPQHVVGEYCRHCGLVAPNVVLYSCCPNTRYCCTNCQTADRTRHIGICPNGQAQTNRAKRAERRHLQSSPKMRRNPINVPGRCLCDSCTEYYCYQGCRKCRVCNFFNTKFSDTDESDTSEDTNEGYSPRKNSPRRNRRRKGRARAVARRIAKV